jgi:hypothetical protein
VGSLQQRFGFGYQLPFVDLTFQFAHQLLERRFEPPRLQHAFHVASQDSRCIRFRICKKASGPVGDLEIGQFGLEATYARCQLNQRIWSIG